MNSSKDGVLIITRLEPVKFYDILGKSIFVSCVHQKTLVLMKLLILLSS